LIDPRDGWKGRWRGDLADESFGVFGIGVEQDDSALFSDRFGPAVVDVGGGMKSNARMTMIVVIPSEKSGTVGMGVFEAAEAIGEVGSVLEGPELRFTERIVITDMGPAERFGHAQVCQEVSHSFGDHG